MGKGPEWSVDETVQLCKSWLHTSQDPIRAAGQKKTTFYQRIYQHWLAHKSPAADTRSEAAIAGRWKKLQPEVTKFEGIYSKVRSRERSGWNEDMYVTASVEIYKDRHKQPFEFLAAWMELRNQPKWTSQLTTTAETKRKAADVPSLTRPGGVKAAKSAAKNDKRTSLENIHLRFVAASEKKAYVLEQQLHFNMFMQAPESEESKKYFAFQRKKILAALEAQEDGTAHTDENIVEAALV